MHSHTLVKTEVVHMRKWVEAEKPYTGTGTGPRTITRVCTWAAKQCAYQAKMYFRMGYINKRWVPISQPNADCEYYVEAVDWGMPTIGVNVFKKEG